MRSELQNWLRFVRREGHILRLFLVALMPNKLLVGEWEGRNRYGRLQVLEQETWRHLSELPPLVNVSGCLAVSASGDKIAVSEGNQIALCNLADRSAGRELVETSIRHSDAFASLSFTAQVERAGGSHPS